MTNEYIFRTALEQSAVDCGCAAEDFLRDENTLFLSKANPAARSYLELPHVADFVYYGHGIVATAGEDYLEAAGRCLELVKGDVPYRLFETPVLQKVEDIFAPLGCTVRYMAEYYLPCVDALCERSCPLPVKLMEPPDLDPYYAAPGFGHALSSRPEMDVLGVGAYDGERLVGMAACSRDCGSMWQIGIDVMPEFRRRGVASALTSRLAAEIIRRGRVPFYCAAWSNVPSARNAIRSGFRPAWVELTVKKREKQKA